MGVLLSGATATMMTLRRLEGRLRQLRKSSSSADAQLVDLLLQVTGSWRSNAESPARLGSSLAKAHGNVWFSTEESSNAVCDLLDEIRKTIDSLGSMTLNERLIVLDLKDRWDAASDAQREQLRAKLSAPA